MTLSHIRLVLTRDASGLYHLTNQDDNHEEGIGNTIDEAERALLTIMHFKDVKFVHCVLDPSINNTHVLHVYSKDTIVVF